MSIALVIQALSMSVRSILFFFLGILHPLDVISDWLQQVSYWLAVDNETILYVNQKYKGKNNDQSNE
jgi:hypothetical protein